MPTWLCQLLYTVGRSAAHQTTLNAEQRLTRASTFDPKRRLPINQHRCAERTRYPCTRFRK